MPHRSHMPILAAFGLAFVMTLFYAPFAFAIGEDVSVGEFVCTAGIANGQLLLSDASCPTSLQIDNVFSFLLCNLEQLTGNILGHMYCGMIYELTPAVWAVATMAVLLFGITFTIGLVPLNGREAIVFLLKIAFVTAFATNADLMVTYGYGFLVGGIKDGVGAVLGGLEISGAESGESIYAMFDKFMYQIFTYVTDALKAETHTDQCKNAVFAVIATMAVAFPILAYLALMLIARVLITFFRAVMGYIYAIVGITFLLVLSPLFIPMYLFKVTRHFFDKWIAYMASFALQMILLFAFLAFVLSLNVSNMTKNLTDIIMYQEQTAETTSFRLPWEYCTLCDFLIVNQETGADMKSDDPELVSKGKLICAPYPPNVPGSAEYDPDKPATDAEGRRPINVTFAIAPDTGSNQMNSLILLAGHGVLSLIILAIAINQVLEVLPSLAVRLAADLGAGYAPQLGGGTSFGGNYSPGRSLTEDFHTGFKQAAETRSANWKNITPDRKIEIEGNRAKNPLMDGNKNVGRAVKDGFNAMITGRGLNNAPLYEDAERQGKAGLQNTWSRFLSNPGRFKD